MKSLLSLITESKRIKKSKGLCIEKLICDASTRLKLAASGLIEGAVVYISKIYSDGSVMLYNTYDSRKLFLGFKIASEIMVRDEFADGARS